jgi:Rod binding domain-containing protein
MDSIKLILNQPVSPPTLLESLNETDRLPDDKKKQIAKDFESVLLGKLLDEMKDTIGDWGLEENGASEQVQGIFWLYLARDIADKGGVGLWKDVYQFLTNPQMLNTSAEPPGDKV